MRRDLMHGCTLMCLGSVCIFLWKETKACRLNVNWSGSKCYSFSLHLKSLNGIYEQQEKTAVVVYVQSPMILFIYGWKKGLRCLDLSFDSFERLLRKKGVKHLKNRWGLKELFFLFFHIRVNFERAYPQCIVTSE